MLNHKNRGSVGMLQLHNYKRDGARGDNLVLKNHRARDEERGCFHINSWRGGMRTVRTSS